MREIISTRLGTHVAIENDANLQALAEVAMGAARGLNDVIYVKVSSGIGGAVRSAAGCGAAIRAPPASSRTSRSATTVRSAAARRRGCLGNFASGHTMVDAIEALHGAHLDLDDVARLAAAGDAGVCRVLADAGREIGLVLASLCSVLNPAAVIVGGELASTGSPLLSGMREGIERGALPASASVRILPAALRELGGALGAASLVARADDIPVHFVEWE